MDISTAMSRALSVTIIESTTRIFNPATNVISPMKIAVTSFSRRNARKSAKFCSIQLVAMKSCPAICSAWRATSLGMLGIVQSEFQHVDDIGRAS